VSIIRIMLAGVMFGEGVGAMLRSVSAGIEIMLASVIMAII
jgi:hypothetical protein